MNKPLKAFCIAAIGTGFSYALISFVKWEFNPSSWSEGTRFILASLSAYSAGGGIAYAFIK